MQEFRAFDYIIFSEDGIKGRLEALADYARKENLAVLCVTKREKEILTFVDVLLDENNFVGIIAVNREILKETGSVNRILKEKRGYELLLRIAEITTVHATNATNIDAVSIKKEPHNANIKEALKTDCYLIGKYRDDLKRNGCFDNAIKKVFYRAVKHGIKEEISVFLKHMIKQDGVFWGIARDTQPILLYKSDDICHNILNLFSEQFGKALQEEGQRVEFFDNKKDASKFFDYIGKQFKAIVGFHTKLFELNYKNIFLHDLIGGGKYNFITDHPIYYRNWFKYHSNIPLVNVEFLTLDNNYVNFYKKYYSKNAYFFPPAGTSLSGTSPKTYPFTFLGSWADYRSSLRVIRKQERNIRFLLNRFLLIMKQNTDFTSEKAFRLALQYYGMNEEENFLEYFSVCVDAMRCIHWYYREKVISKILEEGLELHVFGNSWYKSRFNGYPNLIIHPPVEAKEGVRILQESLITLNVMSWHKAGFTERIANALLGQTVVVSDWSEYLECNFDDGNEIVLFRLQHLDELPKMVKELMTNEEKRQDIGKKGFEKALRFHTWQARAKEFLGILQNEVRVN